MVIGNFGAYIADDDRYDYYIFKCTKDPKEAECDFIFELDGNEFAVKAGEMYCEGLWLEKVGTSNKWYTVTTQKCVVCLQVAVNVMVDLENWSDENPLPRNMERDTSLKAKEYDAMAIDDEDHSFLMEQARRRTELDYTNYVYGVITGKEDDRSEEDEEEISAIEDDDD